MKKFSFILLLFLVAQITSAQSLIIDSPIFSVDKQIPSYLSVAEQNITLSDRRSVSEHNECLEKLLSLDSNTTALVKDTLTDIVGGFHVSYQEYYRGIEVEGTRYTIHYDKFGNATSINGNFRTIKDLDVIPVLNEEEALQAVWVTLIEESGVQESLTKTDKPHGKLVIIIKDDVAYLAFKYYIEGIHSIIFVDANNGNIIEKLNTLIDVSATVGTKYSGQRTIQTNYESGVYRLNDYTRGSGIETEECYYHNLYSTDNTWSGLGFKIGVLDAHWGAETVYDYYYSKFGRYSYDNNGSKIKSDVNLDMYDNASWDNQQHKMNFGFKDGNLIQYPLVSLDIVAHEFTHGVSCATSNLGYMGESGALGEGISDIFAVCVEKYAKPNNGVNIWQIGEDIGTPIRDLSNPECRYYQGTNWVSTSNPSLSNDYGGVHTNCGVIGYWFYLLVNGGAGTNQSGYAVPVESIGLEKAIQICYLMNTAHLTSNSTYSDAKTCSYMAAQELGYDNETISQLKNAWFNVGVESFANLDLSIEGPKFVGNSSSYYISNLPTGYTVTWSLSDSYYNQHCLQQNSPSNNYCTITHSNAGDMSNATLTAVIKRNGTMVKTLTMSGMYCHIGFKGHYTSGNLSGDINYTQIFSVKPNATTYITSPHFLGGAVTYSSSGAIPSIWAFSPTYGDLTLVTTNTSVPVVINVDDVCDNHYTLYGFPQSYSINVSYENNNIDITLVENNDPSRDLSFDQPWTLEIRNAVTGELVFSQSSTSRTESIFTSRWLKGIYIIKVTIDKEELTEKIIVK